MISDIQFVDVHQSKLFAYAATVPFFQKHRSIAFKPGLNVLFGPNGCGKSTLLRMMALYLAAEQGGVSTLTNTWRDEVADWHTQKSTLDGIVVQHDGTPILYGNPRNAVGLFGGSAAFDDDFMMQGLANLKSTASTGYTTMHRLGAMLGTLEGTAAFPAQFDDRIGLLGPSKGSTGRDAVARALLAASIPRGQHTLLFDEPESGLGLPAQNNVFKMLFGAARKHDFQIIVATHSAFALGMPDVNYIEMAPDYMGHCENALEMLHLRFKLKQLTQEAAAKAAAGKNGDPGAATA